MLLGRNDVDAEVARRVGLGELLDVGGARCGGHRLALEIVDRAELLDFLETNRVAVRKCVLINSTCFSRSVLLVVDPHSRSMVPLAISGIRADELTGLSLTSSLSSFSSFFTASTIL